jgi:hypothetical protein
VTTAAPGWYPDPENPAAVRWYDGARWTDHRAPTPPTQQAPATTPSPWSSATGAPITTAWPQATPARTRNPGVVALVVVACVVGGVILIGILAAIAIPVFLNQRAKAELADLSSVTCESIGAEAVATSQAGTVAGEIPLASVSGLTVAQDDRATLQRPTAGHVFVMSCAGTALWQDGVSTPILIELDVDSAVQHVVTFTGQE